MVVMGVASSDPFSASCMSWCLSSWLPNRPRLSAGSRFLQEPKQHGDVLRVFEQLWEILEAATCSEVLAVRGVVNLAVEQHVLHGLNWLATWASHLLWCVLREETLRV